MVLPIFVISLEKRGERRTRLRGHLDRFGVDPDRVTWWVVHPHPTDGRLGCAESHWNVWKQIASSGSPAIVLEDDAVPDCKKSQWQAVDSGLVDEKVMLGCDLLFLGGKLIGPSTVTKKNPFPAHPRVGVELLTLSHCTEGHAYVITPEGARKAMHVIQTRMGTDYRDCALSWSRQLRFQALFPFLWRQFDKHESDNNTLQYAGGQPDGGCAELSQKVCLYGDALEAWILGGPLSRTRVVGWVSNLIFHMRRPPPSALDTTTDRRVELKPRV